MEEGSYRVEIPDDNDICTSVHAGPVTKLTPEDITELTSERARLEKERVNVSIEKYIRRFPWTGVIADYQLEKTHCDVENGSRCCSGKFGTTYEIASHVIEGPTCETLLVCESDGYSFGAFCPLCKRYVDSDRIETDDYVGSNVLFWCLKDGEVLLCATGTQRENNDLSRIADGALPHSECLVELSEAEAKTYATTHGFPWDKITTDSLEGFRYFRSGVLRITHLAPSGDAESDEELSEKGRPAISWTALPAPVMCFGDVPKGIDTAHDGVVLHYRGTCGKCGAQHEDDIWGD